MKYQVSFHETKHDIFTPENYMLFSNVERSPLLWSHVKSHLSQKSTEVNGLVTFGVYIIKLEHYIYSHLEIQMFRIFQQEKGLILYLYMTM